MATRPALAGVQYHESVLETEFRQSAGFDAASPVGRFPAGGVHHLNMV